MINSLSTILLLFQVAITLIIVSNQVLSHFSSTVFALSWVNAEVLLSSEVVCLSSSWDANKIVNNPTNNFRGFRLKLELLPFIIFELLFEQSHCQSSSIGFNKTCIAADSSSSNLENAFVILLIGSDSNFWYVFIGKKKFLVVFKYVVE